MVFLVVLMVWMRSDRDRDCGGDDKFVGVMA
jgi:hypothetical protein